MSAKHIEELLQQCLMAFDAGLAPEECLSAFPAARQELEPLFRQAISLRVAFAAAPRPEFRARTRERMLFMAGREVSVALASEPAPEFIQDARQRFIRAAGADAQELLRDVAPPRLPFWINARRRLLEAAAASQAQPAPRRNSGFAMRVGLSAAVVVLALAVSGLGYMIGFNNTPTGASAELAQLEHDISEIEAQQKVGGTVSAAALQDLSDRTNRLLGQLEQQHSSPAIVEKLPELIDRQKTVVLAAVSQGILEPELAQAQTQQLEEAEKVVEEIKLAAAQAPTATVEAAATNTATAGKTATPATSASAGASTTPVPTNQVRVTALPNDTFGNQAWKRLETANLSISVPATWEFSGGVTVNPAGVAAFEGSYLILNGPSGGGVIINVTTGQVTATLGTGTLTLRTSGVNGQLISPEDLAARVAPALVGDFRHIVESVTLSGALIATPAPTQPPSSTPSTTPSSTSTPPPSATP